MDERAARRELVELPDETRPRSSGRAALGGPRARRRAPGTRSRRTRAPARRRGRSRLPPAMCRERARTSGDEPDAADHRRGVDRAAVRVVVERDVARDDGDPERLARGGHALDRLGQLPGDLRLLGIAEVEAVRDRERLAAGAGDVPRGLEDGQRAAGVRIEARDPARAVEADRKAAVRRAEANDRGVEPRTADRS